MSQAGIVNQASGPVPPAVATTYVTDVNSPAVPAANILDVFGASSTSDDTDGIRTDGSSGGNVLTVQLTNRISGTATTTDAVTPQTLFMFDLGSTAGSYLFVNYLTFYNVTDGIGGAIISYTYARTNGVFVPVPPNISGAFDAFDAGLGGVIFDMSFPGGFPNNYVPQVTGVAGKTINFRLLTTYTFVS